MPIGKLFLLVVFILVIWYGFKYVNRVEEIRQTFKRHRVFNDFARARRLRTISLWRNRRFYLQLLRAGTPDFLYSLYYRRFYPTAPTPAKSTPNP